MKGTCAKCKRKLDTEKGDIMTVYPVFFNGEFLPFVLCRPHAIESDSMTDSEFRKWVHKKESASSV